MSARKCHCGTAIQLDDNGDFRCMNGHTQPEAIGDLVCAVAELVAGPLRELRATLEEQGVEVESLREAVEALHAERNAPEVEWVDLAEMARRLGRSRDYMYRHARELGGRQFKPRGRWLFNPNITMELLVVQTETPTLGKLFLGSSVLPPRPLPGSVPLLPVKDRAA